MPDGIPRDPVTLTDRVPVYNPSRDHGVLRELLLANITKTPSGCWEWQRSTSPHGYGQLHDGDRKATTHRVSVAVFRGPFPRTSHVLHRCDNPPCVNPDHLFLGTHQDNMADRDRKGRVRGLPHREGMGNPASTLLPEQIADVLTRLDAGETRRALAREYGVCEQAIYLWRTQKNRADGYAVYLKRLGGAA